MSEQEVIHMVARLKRCEARKAEWSNEAKAIKDALAAEMDARATDEITAGKLRVIRTRYVREQVDAKALKERAPEVYALYCVGREVVTLKVT